MNLLIQQIWQLFMDIWATGSRWARVLIIFLVAYPLVLMVVAFLPWPVLTAVIGILAVAIIILTPLVFIDPLVIAVATKFENLKQILFAVSITIGMEIALSIYFVTVPVTSNRGLIPVVILVVCALAFLSAGRTDTKLVSVVRSILVMLFTGLTLTFFLKQFFPQTIGALNIAKANFDNKWGMAIADTVKPSRITAQSKPKSLSPPKKSPKKLTKYPTMTVPRGTEYDLDTGEGIIVELSHIGTGLIRVGNEYSLYRFSVDIGDDATEAEIFFPDERKFLQNKTGTFLLIPQKGGAVYQKPVSGFGNSNNHTFSLKGKGRVVVIKFE